MSSVVVIDYGMGNLRSVAKAFESLGADVRVTDDPKELATADRVVFPGVGAFAECMTRMDGSGFSDAVRAFVRDRQRPLLGICLGMQGLVEHGDEGGERKGLGLILGDVRKFDVAEIGPLKVPHMGWNEVVPTGDHPLLIGVEPSDCFYFVHSYYVDAPNSVAATCDYGRPFAAAIARDNVFGIQCHPEKSQRPGLRVLANFLAWSP